MMRCERGLERRDRDKQRCRLTYVSQVDTVEARDLMMGVTDKSDVSYSNGICLEGSSDPNHLREGQ
jgi:hypothetical protein